MIPILKTNHCLPGALSYDDNISVQNSSIHLLLFL